MAEIKSSPVQRLNPPYVGAPTLSRVFDMLSSRSLPSLTASDLANRGFSQSVSFQIVQALKFLGFLDGENKMTEKSKSLYVRGEERKSKLQEIVKSAYSKLFEVAREANLLPKDELHNEFLAVYGLSPRLASSAAPTFLWLCSEAGMEVKEEQVLKTRTVVPKVHSVGVTKTLKYNIKSNSSQPENSSGYNTYPLKSGVVVKIPESLAVQWTLEGTLASKLKQFETTGTVVTDAEDKNGGVAESE